MSQSQAKADSGRVAPALRRWCDQGAAGEQKTAIIKPSYAVSLKDAKRSLETSGAEVQSSGRGAITVVVSPASLAEVARLPWVVSIEEPRRMYAGRPAG